MELEALQGIVEDIRHNGASLVAISPQLPKFSKQVVKKHHLDFPVLTDVNNEVASSFGLTFSLPKDLITIYSGFGIDLERFNGNDFWQLPLPGRFIIGTDGVIKSVEVHPDYTKRPDPDQIIDLLKSI